MAAGLLLLVVRGGPGPAGAEPSGEPLPPPMADSEEAATAVLPRGTVFRPAGTASDRGPRPSSAEDAVPATVWLAGGGTAGSDAASEAEEGEEADPWQAFNEPVFEFNRQLDRFLVKPVATVWARVVPEDLRRGLRNAADNLGMPRRVAHSLLQLKVEGAVRELARFVLNSTLGVGGLFDVARAAGVRPSDEDAGQTLGVWGVGPGPYLVLPVLPPSTVRDTLGAVVDLALDPLTFVLSTPQSVARRVGTAVNERSLNLELFQEVEETVLDLYSAVRNAYLQRRARQVRE